MLGKILLPRIKATGRADKFSQNLMKFIKKHHDKQLFVAYAPEESKPYDPTKTQAGNLYVGFGDLQDGWLHGARLSEILGQGIKVSTWAFPPKMSFVEVPGWFDRYTNGGKCFIDPEHILYHDRERWQEEGDSRTCLWCGNHRQVKHRYQVQREEWLNEVMGG